MFVIVFWAQAECQQACLLVWLGVCLTPWKAVMCFLKTRNLRPRITLPLLLVLFALAAGLLPACVCVKNKILPSKDGLELSSDRGRHVLWCSDSTWIWFHCLNTRIVLLDFPGDLLTLSPLIQKWFSQCSTYLLLIYLYLLNLLQHVSLGTESGGGSGTIEDTILEKNIC